MGAYSYRKQNAFGDAQPQVRLGHGLGEPARDRIKRYGDAHHADRHEQPHQSAQQHQAPLCGNVGQWASQDRTGSIGIHHAHEHGDDEQCTHGARQACVAPSGERAARDRIGNRYYGGFPFDATPRRLACASDSIIIIDSERSISGICRSKPGAFGAEGWRCWNPPLLLVKALVWDTMSWIRRTYLKTLSYIANRLIELMLRSLDRREG